MSKVQERKVAGLEAKDLYLSVLRLQYRYNTQVTQIFSDRGSQISGKILGKTRNHYQKSMKRLWGVHNNLGYSQFRNLAERKISTLKRLIRQGIFGIPSPQQEVVDRSILETAVQGANECLLIVVHENNSSSSSSFLSVSFFYDPLVQTGFLKVVKKEESTKRKDIWIQDPEEGFRK
jgi:hypothetical protein